MIVNKNQVILFLYTSLLIILAFAAQNLENTLMFAVAALPVVINVGINAVKNHNWLYVCFLGLIAEVYYVMMLCIFFIKGAETSWRVPYAIPLYNNISTKYAFISLMLLCLVYVMFCYKKNEVLQNDIILKVSPRKFQIQLFLIIYAIIILYYIIQLPVMGARNYMNNVNIMVMALFRACCLLGWILVASTEGKRSRILVIECVFASVVVLVLSIYGYRFIIFETVIMLAILNLSKLRKIKIRTWIILAVFVVLFYIVLIYIKGKYVDRATASVAFTHEKNLFYSFNAIIANMGGDIRLDTYWSALMNILPKALTGSTDLNTGALLMQYINFDIYLTSGVNMGGYYLAEAYANFGGMGVYTVTLFFGLLFVIIEKKRKKDMKFKALFLCVYYGLVSQTYGMVYYGSSNYVKFLVYYIIFAFVIVTPMSLIGSARIKKDTSETITQKQ